MKDVQIPHDIAVACAWMKNYRVYDVNFTQEGVSIGVNKLDKVAEVAMLLRGCGIRVDQMKTRVRLQLNTLGSIFNTVMVLYTLSGHEMPTSYSNGLRITFRAEGVPPLVKEFLSSYRFEGEFDSLGYGGELSLSIEDSFTHIQVLKDLIDMTIDCNGLDAFKSVVATRVT
ncbi:hypothetical protein VPHK397_0086 [Vibrio phage K397]